MRPMLSLEKPAKAGEFFRADALSHSMKADVGHVAGSRGVYGFVYVRSG